MGPMLKDGEELLSYYRNVILQYFQVSSRLSLAYPLVAWISLSFASGIASGEILGYEEKAPTGAQLRLIYGRDLPRAMSYNKRMLEALSAFGWRLRNRRRMSISA